MKKTLLFCSLLALAANLFAAVGDQLADVAQITDATTYKLRVNRGYLPSDLTLLKATEDQAGLYAFIKSEAIEGGYYLYNTETKKFVSSASVKYTSGDAALYLDMPDGHFTLTETAGGSKKWIVASGATGNYMQLGGVGEFVLNTGWKTLDDGNQWIVTEAGEHDPAEAVEAMREWEKIMNQPEEVVDGVIFVYDGTARHNTVYRIPAITSIAAGPHKNRVVALTDYRPGGGDVGQGEVDLHCRYSDDFGQTWSKEIVVVDGTWGSPKGTRWYSFGDPVIVADRETGKLLLVSCSGNKFFSNNTRHDHQGVEVYYSEDGGETWTEPVDVSEQLYSALDSRKLGVVQSLFVGSGAFTQSRFVKKGDYYRVYGGIICLGGTNYTIYTDDFGKTWELLGGPDGMSVETDGNEAKVEELPDGSVLHSSRCMGGRIFNIWRWDDNTFTTGKWDGQVYSNSGNNGIVAAGNSCNGEIRILPARRKSDGRCVYLAMQSIPFGSGRANVGIYWKEIASVADYATTAQFAANWTKGLQVSTLNSAYSAMTLQEDGNIGFMVEECTFKNLGYSQVYHSLTYEKITGGRYTFKSDRDDDFDQSEFIKQRGRVTYNLYWEGELMRTVTASGYYGDALPEPELPAFTVPAGIPALFMNETTDGQTFDVEVMWDAEAPVQLYDPLFRNYYYLYIKDNSYLINTGEASISVNKTNYTRGDAHAMWAFEGNPFTGLRIWNEPCGEKEIDSFRGFLASADPRNDGNTGGATYPHVVAELAGGESGLWTLRSSSYYAGGFFVFNADWGCAINHRAPNLAFWTGGNDAGSTVRAVKVPERDVNKLVPDGVHGIGAAATATAVYDLQGRRVTVRPRHGVFVTGGKKAIVK